MKTPFPNSIVYLFGVLTFFSECTKNHVNQPPVADAGPSQTVNLLQKAGIAISGSGTDADGKVVAYLWSAVSGPNSPNISIPGAQSTQVTGLAEGNYIFQLMVTDNNGATGTDTVSIKINPAIKDTIYFQPHNNPTEKHFFGNSTGIDQSSAAAPEIGAAAWTTGGQPIAMRAALKFDLSSIPASAIINSANLVLFSNHTPLNGNQTDANYGADNSLLIQQISSPWDPATATWNGQPSTTSANQIISPSTTQSFLDLNLDVTAMVADMVNSEENFGFFLRLQTETIYTSRIFCSSKYSDLTRHPALVIVYTKTE